jgi:hypothetical protein
MAVVVALIAKYIGLRPELWPLRDVEEAVLAAFATHKLFSAVM